MYRFFIGILAAVGFALSACGGTDATPATRPTLAPTAVVASPSFATVTATANVLPVRPDGPAVVATRACNSAPSTRLIVGERGQVRDEDPRPLNVRSGPGTEFRILGRLETLDIFRVLEGPTCGGDFVWYLIRRGALEGWVAEGDFTSYYTRPYLPG